MSLVFRVAGFKFRVSGSGPAEAGRHFLKRFSKNTQRQETQSSQRFYRLLNSSTAQLLNSPGPFQGFLFPEYGGSWNGIPPGACSKDI